MRKLIATFLTTTLSAAALVADPQLARTTAGKYVRLDDDGKWTYLTESGLNEFLGKTQAGELKSTIFPGAGLKFQSNKWNLTNSTNKDAEFTLRDLGDGLYCMFIPEKGSFSLELLKQAVVENAKSAVDSYNIVSEERRVINGKEFLILKAAITMKRTNFLFKYALYSQDGYSLQTIVYGLEEPFKANEAIADKLLFEGVIVP
ncbi:MAG TPA: hypothetical protein PKX74_05770 [Leptospiraceae bacterium]|nr:hypothetical protein [Leptospiraceae bacterium]